jgi:hypothetical protein
LCRLPQRFKLLTSSVANKLRMLGRNPALTSWFDRCKETVGYRKGIEGWLNTKYLELMKERGLATKAAIRGLSDPPLHANIAA